jgi:cytochrome P450
MLESGKIPPGPEGHRFVGNLPEFSKDPLAFLTHCARTYGDIVRLGDRNFLLAHPDLIGTVLKDRASEFVKSTSTNGRPRSGFPEAMMNSEGQDWLTKRHLLQPLFHNSRIARFASTISERTEAMLQRWQDGDVLDVRREISRLTLGLVVSFLFDDEIGDGWRDVNAAVEGVMDLTASSVRFPARLPTPTNIRLSRSLRRLDRVIDDLIERHRAGLSHGMLLTALVGGDATHGHMRDEIATLLMSGHETTSDALVWLWHLVSLHPEIDAVMAREVSEVADGQAISDVHLRGLSYIDATVRETMRLYPPAWLTHREASRNCEIAGYQVMAGTALAISQWVTHRDPRFFENPMEFRPERWVRGSRSALPKFAYFPFGGGPRLCIGARLAMVEMILITATICRRFKLLPAPSESVRPRPALALQPLGVQLIATPRMTG